MRFMEASWMPLVISSILVSRCTSKAGTVTVKDVFVGDEEELGEGDGRL